MPTKLILRSFQAPGDILMLTAAVRDLHLSNPGAFVTDVRTSAPQLWEHNRFITPLADDDDEATVVECSYPLIHESNSLPRHFIEGYAEFLAGTLGVRIRPTAFKPHIELSPDETHWMSQVSEIVREDVPFWIVVAGGKLDFTAKWWIPERWQQVIDRLADRVLFVQCGEAGHVHRPLTGVIDLVGRTDVRQFVRLMYHAQGVICPVTFAMHLAAAVPMKGPQPANRPCVVIAGGREPTQWEAYPHHRYLNTNGCLPCCDNGGCWKSRTVPLGDGDEQDKSLCLNLTPDRHQKCMDMIAVDDVVRAVESYFIGGVCQPVETTRFRKYLTG